MNKTALIVYGGMDGHEPKETGQLVSADLKDAGFTVEMSDSLNIFGDEARLKTFDLIVPHWTMGQITWEQETALLHAVASGVGLGGFHGGMGDAFRQSTGYQFLVGGQFVAHPDDHKEYLVHFVKPADPILAGMSDFTVHTEQYFMHVDPSNEVLATTTFETTSTPWVNGTVMPVIWKRKYGTGRVFYQSIGHSQKEFKIPQVREITKRGFVWAARPES